MSYADLFLETREASNECQKGETLTKRLFQHVSLDLAGYDDGTDTTIPWIHRTNDPKCVTDLFPHNIVPGE